MEPILIFNMALNETTAFIQIDIHQVTALPHGQAVYSVLL